MESGSNWLGSWLRLRRDRGGPRLVARHLGARARRTARHLQALGHLHLLGFRLRLGLGRRFRFGFGLFGFRRGFGFGFRFGGRGGLGRGFGLFLRLRLGLRGGVVVLARLRGALLFHDLAGLETARHVCEFLHRHQIDRQRHLGLNLEGFGRGKADDGHRQDGGVCDARYREAHAHDAGATRSSPGR